MNNSVNHVSVIRHRYCCFNTYIFNGRNNAASQNVDRFNAHNLNLHPSAACVSPLQIIKSSSVVCVTVSHLSYASRLLSAVLVATFTVERFIGVVYPMRRTSLLSVSHARRAIGAEALVCAALATFTTFTIGIDTSQKQKLGFNDTDCDIITGMSQVYLGFNVAFLIVGSIIAPVLIIVALNAAILTRIVGRDRLGLFGSDSSGAHDLAAAAAAAASTPNAASHSAHGRHCHSRGGGQRYEYNVTLLLLVVSTSFVVLNVPYCVCWFVLFVKVGWNPDPAGPPPTCAERQVIGSLHAAKYIASVPYYLNYGINFALYSVCARAFRMQLCRLATVVRRRATCQRSASTVDLSGSGIEGVDAGGTEGYRRRLQMRREVAAAARLKLPGYVGELGPVRMRTRSEPPSGRRCRRKSPDEVDDDDQVSRVATN